MSSTQQIAKVAPSASGNRTRANGAVVVQRGELLFFGAIPAKKLVKQAKVDTFDPNTKQGYQRDRVASRVRAASDYYEAGGRFPNPILANIREIDFDKVRVEVTEDETGFQDAVESDGDWIGAGFIEFPEDVVLWVYDGQHREGGIEDLVARLPAFDTFPVPVAITVGLTEAEEMTEFYEVNTNAKSVKTDLAWELLRKRAEVDPDLARLLDEKGQDWILRGQQVVEELEKIDGPWRDSIQTPNQRKVKADRLTIPQAQFVRSLKPVLDMPLLAKGEPATIATIVNAYWQAIARVLPEPFDPTKNPKNWVIQKGPGAISFNRVLPQVIEVLRARGKGLADVDAYEEVLADIPTLSGQVTSEDGGYTTVSGTDFWVSGPQGVASAFTGDAGRKRLGVMIQVLLPKPTSEIVL